MIATIGAVLLALCGVPTAWRAYKRPASTRDLSWAFLAMWGLGEVLMLAGLWYVMPWAVRLNYAGNAVLVAYVCWRKAGLCST